jgi:hypothetical protein
MGKAGARLAPSTGGPGEGLAMDLRSSLTRGAAAAAVVPLGLTLTATEARAGSASQRQNFSFTSQHTGERITCGIEHAVSAQVNAENNLLVFGETEVVEGPAVCDDSFATIRVSLDNGTDDDLSQYAYGTGGYVAFSNHFPSSWKFTGSHHTVYFDACSCYAPPVSLRPK